MNRGGWLITCQKKFENFSGVAYVCTVWSLDWGPRAPPSDSWRYWVMWLSVVPPFEVSSLLVSCLPYYFVVDLLLSRFLFLFWPGRALRYQPKSERSGAMLVVMKIELNSNWCDAIRWLFGNFSKIPFSSGDWINLHYEFVPSFFLCRSLA